MERVKFDKWGYEVKTTSDSCISAINEYYNQVLNYGRKKKVILEAPLHDKNCVLGNILAAHFLFTSDPPAATVYLQAAKSALDQASSYEKTVFEAINCLYSEDRDDHVAIELHSKLLNKFPRDLVSLKRAQILCFYLGNAELSLDLVQQVLHENEQEEYVYGMLAFPLLELGRMTEAEEAAKKGLTINKQDCWSQHCLCHVLQYECRFEEAVRFMEGCSPSWNSCSSFILTHNWWHVALCYLEGYSPISKVVEIYDRCIMEELERPDAVAAEVYLNALGLLLRVHVRGETHVFGDRIRNLAGRVANKKFWYLEWHLDMLILWALATTGKFSESQDLLKGLKFRASQMSKKKQQLMQKGLVLAEALYEYSTGNDKRGVELLGLDFDASDYRTIGASDEQIDVFNEVWYIMLLNTGQATKVIETISKRIKTREGVSFLWRLLERAYLMAGRPEARTVGEKARKLEAAYFKS